MSRLVPRAVALVQSRPPGPCSRAYRRSVAHEQHKHRAGWSATPPSERKQVGSAVREETGRGPHTSLAGRLVVLAKNRAGQVSVHLRGATRAPPPCKCCSLGTIKPSAVVREETDTRKGLPSDRKQASPPRHRSLSIAQPRGPRGDSEKEQIATGAPARRYHSSMSIHRWKEPLEYVNNAQGPGVRATSLPPPPHERQQASGVAAGVRVPRSFTCSTSFIAPLPPVTAFAAGRVAAMPRFCLPSLRWGVVIGKQHGEIIRTIFFTACSASPLLARPSAASGSQACAAWGCAAGSRVPRAPARSSRT